MDMEEYVKRYAGLIRWTIIHKTRLLYDEQDDRFQDVFFYIFNNKDKYDNMDEKKRTHYIALLTRYFNVRRSWGNGKFITIQDWSEWRAENGYKEDADGLDWLDDGGRYRPDTGFWHSLERRQRREYREDQLEQYEKIKKYTLQVKNIITYGSKKSQESNLIKKSIKINPMATIYKIDPLLRQKQKMAQKAYRTLNAHKIKERALEYNTAKKYADTVFGNAFMKAVENGKEGTNGK